MSQEIQPRPDCPRCFGTGIHTATTFPGAMPSVGMPCQLCLQAAAKKIEPHPAKERRLDGAQDEEVSNLLSDLIRLDAVANPHRSTTYLADE